MRMPWTWEMGAEWNCNTKMEHSCGYGRWVTGVEKGSGLDMELDMGSGHGKHDRLNASDLACGHSLGPSTVAPRIQDDPLPPKGMYPGVLSHARCPVRRCRLGYLRDLWPWSFQTLGPRGRGLRRVPLRPLKVHNMLNDLFGSSWSNHL